LLCLSVSVADLRWMCSRCKHRLYGCYIRLQVTSHITYPFPFLQRVRIARNAERCNSHDRSVCLSVCPSGCPSRSGVLSMNEDTIVRSSASGRTIILVSKEVNVICTFAESHPSEGVKVNRPRVASGNLINNQP